MLGVGGADYLADQSQERRMKAIGDWGQVRIRSVSGKEIYLMLRALSDTLAAVPQQATTTRT